MSRPLDSASVAILVGMDEKRVAELVRDDNTFPRPTISDGKPFWHLEEILNWIAFHRGTGWLRHHHHQIHY